MGEQQFDVIIVGAGFGGIGAAIQLKNLGYEKIVILDREDDLGGTWHVNHYPGLSVDQPSPTFSYRFEPNPYWSRMYAPGSELKSYAVRVAEKYDVRRFMRFNTTVEGARWDEDAQVWRLAIAGGETLSAQFLIVATGFLCQPKIPDIAGIETFAGRIIHTAAWDHSYPLAGRRAAVIGTGSTGVQVVPELAKEVAELTVYQRTPIWVLPKFDVVFFPAVQKLFARFPATQRLVRAYTDAILEWSMVITMWKYRYFKVFNKGITKSHVHLDTNGIDRIEPDGIVSKDGTKREIDTLVLATGFDVWEANLPAIEVIGRDGRNLGKWWRETRFQAYQGISMPSFPNFLSMASPYAWVGLSWFNTVEYQMKHMERLFGEVQRRGARTFEVTEEANAQFLDRMTKLMEDSAFELGSCVTSRSYWFRDHTGKGEAPLFRPTSVRSAVKEQERFPLSDYAIA
jgi:cation diffusion facilitator CzcD-associated flavoprotein CzcO